MSPNMFFKISCMREQFVTQRTTVLLSFGLISGKRCCVIPIYFLLKSWGAACLLISTVICQFPKNASFTIK